MEDLQLWESGTARLKALLSGLPSKAEYDLLCHLARYRETKEAYAAVVAGVNAAFLCQECGGECCLNGKYRLNLFDAAALVFADITVPVAFMQKPLCPYGAATGCSLEPTLRPADCVLFICDAIDRKLSVMGRDKLAEQEHEMRDCITAASQLLGESMGTPLLLWAAQKK